MTTLAEDRDSWKAGGVIRRDFRHTLGEPEVARHRRARGKGMGKWCRRKPGREHGPPVSVTRSTRMTVDVCAACGKHVNWHWLGW